MIKRRSNVVKDSKKTNKQVVQDKYLKGKVGSRQTVHLESVVRMEKFFYKYILV